MNVAAFATKGTGSNDEDRILALLAPLVPTALPFDKRAKRAGFRSVLRAVAATRPDLLVMEGTGLAGGLACLLARAVYGTRYVVSSGDAVGPFVEAHVRGLGVPFGLYERVLCRLSAGFIGWTPYLAGRALTLGAPRAVTAEGWAPVTPPPDGLAAARRRVRGELGIADGALVVGIVGSLAWNRRAGYCYGYELVRAMAAVTRPDAVALVVGGGSGLARLRDLAGPLLGSRVLLPGEVPADRAVDYMAAMDVGSLPQSVDGVGSFRYTTKLSEYLAAGLPVVTSQVPMAYDLGLDWAWRLPGRTPWGDPFIAALAALVDGLTPAAVAAKRAATAAGRAPFDRDRQVERVSAFVRDLLYVPTGAPPEGARAIAG